MTVGEFSTHFSDVLEQVKAGVSFAGTYGRNKKWYVIFLAELQLDNPDRNLGLLEGKLSVDLEGLLLH